ncbi:hypothetical protein V1477_010781, partial [Vespula maculifrons]
KTRGPSALGRRCWAAVTAAANGGGGASGGGGYDAGRGVYGGESVPEHDFG